VYIEHTESVKGGKQGYIYALYSGTFTNAPATLQMIILMLAIGRTISRMGSESFRLQMVILMMAIGRMI